MNAFASSVCEKRIAVWYAATEEVPLPITFYSYKNITSGPLCWWESQFILLQLSKPTPWPPIRKGFHADQMSPNTSYIAKRVASNIATMNVNGESFTVLYHQALCTLKSKLENTSLCMEATIMY